MSASLDTNICKQLSELVEALTTCGKSELDQEQLKKVKKICRFSDMYVEHLYHLLMYQLEADHAEVRFSALLICDEIFRRSHQFRELMVSDFQTFLELTVETDPDQELPPPVLVAKKLKCKALEFIQQWHDGYGSGYKKLALGYNFLRECKKVDFDNIHARGVAERRQEEEKRVRQENINKEKLQKCLDEMNDLMPEIESCLRQMQECFKLMVPAHLQIFSDTDFDNSQPCCSKSLPNDTFIAKSANTKMTSAAMKDDVDEKVNTPTPSSTNSNPRVENSANESEEELEEGDWMREHGLGNANYKLSVEVKPENLRTKVTSDNLAVAEILREFHQLAAGKYTSSIAKWMQVIIKCSGPGEQLKKAIDLKNSVEETLKKCKELGIDSKNVPLVDDDEDEDDFEEVETKEGYEPVIPQHLRAEYGLEPASSVTANKGFKVTAKDWNPQSSSIEELQDPTSLISNVECLKAAILKKEPTTSASAVQGTKPNTENGAKCIAGVPKLRFDTDLLNWGDENPQMPSVIKMDSLHRFWQPIENETSEVAKPEEIAALRERVIEFSGKFEPVKWQCRAPMKSGSLCPRRDRLKCPFHGPIIPRDAIGNPTNPEDRKRLEEAKERHERENPEWQDPTFLKELEAATGIDLTIKKKGKKGVTKGKKRKYPGLTDLNANQSTSRTRLEDKIFHPSAVKRVAGSLDSLDHKKFNDKYGNQWNYSFNT